jgi:hypothetical protein
MGRLIDFFSSIIGICIGMYIAEDIIMDHFGYYNKTRVEKLMAEVMQETYRGQCLCFKP